jgi:hypothetical protein
VWGIFRCLWGFQMCIIYLLVCWKKYITKQTYIWIVLWFFLMWMRVA